MIRSTDHSIMRVLMRLLPGFFLVLFCGFFFVSATSRATFTTGSSVSFRILWQEGKPEGSFALTLGALNKLHVLTGSAQVNGREFRFRSPGEVKIEASCTAVSTDPGSYTTIVHVQTVRHPFSFFLRDVNKQFPVYIPDYGVIVTTPDDDRSFDQIVQDIGNKGLSLKLTEINREPEYSYEKAAKTTVDQPCPTWLGVSRDIRIFSVNFARRNEPAEMGIITPKMAASPVFHAKDEAREIHYGFAVGRGAGPVLDVERSLDEGFLPILHTELVDEDIIYKTICFASMERSMLDRDGPGGTHFLVADSYTFGHMFTEDQKNLLERIKGNEIQTEEETVIYFRAEAINRSAAPRYAWFKTISPGRGWWDRYDYNYDPATGFSSFGDEEIYAVSKMNGKPLPQEEMAVLLMPGERTVFEFYLPHRPLSPERAEKLKDQDLDRRLNDCRKFWMGKMSRASNIILPEKRIQDMMNAGLLHLDLVTYGNEPEGSLAPTIGVYSPIGTESSPIIQYYDSRGWHETARRSIQYFLDKQHEDGLIQNFGGYMVETGAALWTMGEYFRYTRDTAWLVASKDKLLLSGRFLIDWRSDNYIDSLRGKGYGMITGKVADPADDFHQFMLNGYGYLGLSRLAEMLETVDPDNAASISKEAAEWKADIRESLFRAVSLSPVVPLGDGTWCPTVPPWPETKGLQALFSEPDHTYSHGTFTIRDVLLGPMYLVFTEVLDSREMLTEMMLKYHTELLFQNNAAFSQPYYSRHAWLQLKNDLVKPFLKTYYTTFSAMADRDTYSFWEHIYHASSHKTHEEAWFLMQSRWMLYMEAGDTLKLLRGIPRAWLMDGEKILIDNAASYFGRFSLEVNSASGNRYVVGRIVCDPSRKPRIVSIRLPHPEGRKPVNIIGGKYEESTETLIIDPFTGESFFRLDY